LEKSIKLKQIVKKTIKTLLQELQNVPKTKISNLKMASYSTGQTALANASNHTFNQGYRPRLIEFYGYEGEDFRHFQEILVKYFKYSK
jgi:predicted alpha/beta-fold hydrolase